LNKRLNKFVYDNQLTFVVERSIMDNTLVDFEVVNHMKTNRHNSNNNVALKLDITKAYVRIECVYLKEVMLKLGFTSQWVRWIRMHVKYVDDSIIINNNFIVLITLRRGVYQGDPLSSYLFILCVEVLSTLIRQAERMGDLHGIQICLCWSIWPIRLEGVNSILKKFFRVLTKRDLN